jgi:hypothetical protein
MVFSYLSNGLEVCCVSGFLGLPEGDVKAILDLVKRLREEEKRVIEEFKELRRYYYLGYLPVTCRVKVNV